MPTIRDVAAEAGVSKSTVSHVVNGTRFVEPATAGRVRAAIESLGYHPNSLARSLRRRVTHTIGLLVPDNANPYFAEVARAIEDEGFAEGYSVVLCNSDLSPEKQAAYIDVLLAKRVDGLIIVSAGLIPNKDRPNPIRPILEAGVPCVIIDSDLEGMPVDQVLVDNEQGGWLAGRHLTGLGHRRIACLVGPNDLTPSAGRIAGLRRALAEAGVVLEPEAIVSGNGRSDGGEAAVGELFQRGISFSALFAFNDLMAIGALGALGRAGLQVPGDVSVVGFDDVPLAAAVYPALTTVTQPVAELGQRSVRLLLDRIAERASPFARVILPTSLVERESCAAPARARAAHDGAAVAMRGV